MRAYAVIVFFQCIQSVMTKGVLRGGGDTKFLMKADILFMWLVYRRSGPGLARMADHPLSADRLCHQIGLVRHTVKERKMDTFCGGRLSPGTKLKIF